VSDVDLKPFQIDAESRLMDALEGEGRDVVFKSCTGSGKTIVLTDLMQRFCQTRPGTVWIWFTPGKGDLAGQSKDKADRYVHGAQTKLLADVLNSGFADGDLCFVNWEKLHGRHNVAMTEAERLNFVERLDAAHEEGLSFYVVIDESHTNDTVKTKELVGYVDPVKVIRSSATPKGYKDATLVEVDEDDVIEQGLIKKAIVINQDVPVDVTVPNEIDALLEYGLRKRSELQSRYSALGVGVNPLVIVQLADNDPQQRERVELTLDDDYGITYDNGLLASWLSDDHRNCEGIDEPDARPQVVLIKQAVATGWDCPRAQVLVKLRENMGETFQIQTIGRIRRMPQARHYGDDLLDNCYIYTLDSKFIDEARAAAGGDLLDARTLRLRPGLREFTLPSEQRAVGAADRLDYRALGKALAATLAADLGLSNDLGRNRKLFERAGWDFRSDLLDTTQEGSVEHLKVGEIDSLTTVTFRVRRPAKKLHDEYSRETWKMAQSLRIERRQMAPILQRLFLAPARGRSRLLSLDQEGFYSFVLNNRERLSGALIRALSAVGAMDVIPGADLAGVLERPFHLPDTMLFTYDSRAKDQSVMEKNVYEGYLVSAQKRSTGERLFERFCERNVSVKWLYKNGDKGIEYLSILFDDNSGRSRAFYPDYVVRTRDGQTWVIEVKGGQSASGQDQNIDEFAPMKFAAMRRYLGKHPELRGGFVRYDQESAQLLIATERYSDELKDDCWAPLN
jgi:type III restriction enzyme